MRNDEVQLPQQRRGHSAQRNRHRQAKARIGIAPETKAGPEQTIENEKDTNHIVASPITRLTLTNTRQELTNW